MAQLFAVLDRQDNVIMNSSSSSSSGGGNGGGGKSTPSDYSRIVRTLQSLRSIGVKLNHQQYYQHHHHHDHHYEQQQHGGQHVQQQQQEQHVVIAPYTSCRDMPSTDTVFIMGLSDAKNPSRIKSAVLPLPPLPLPQSRAVGAESPQQTSSSSLPQSANTEEIIHRLFPDSNDLNNNNNTTTTTNMSSRMKTQRDTHIEAERRVFYNMVGAARSQLYLSCAASYLTTTPATTAAMGNNNSSTTVRRQTPRQVRPSRFISELLWRKEEEEEEEEVSDTTGKKKKKRRKKSKAPTVDELVQQLVQNTSSPSSSSSGLLYSYSNNNISKSGDVDDVYDKTADIQPQLIIGSEITPTEQKQSLLLSLIPAPAIPTTEDDNTPSLTSPSSTTSLSSLSSSVDYNRVWGHLGIDRLLPFIFPHTAVKAAQKERAASTADDATSSSSSSSRRADASSSDNDTDVNHVSTTTTTGEAEAEDMSTKWLPLSYSRIDMYERCPSKYYFSFIRRYISI